MSAPLLTATCWWVGCLCHPWKTVPDPSGRLTACSTVCSFTIAFFAAHNRPSSHHMIPIQEKQCPSWITCRLPLSKPLPCCYVNRTTQSMCPMCPSVLLCGTSSGPGTLFVCSLLRHRHKTSCYYSLLFSFFSPLFNTVCGTLLLLVHHTSF